SRPRQRSRRIITVAPPTASAVRVAADRHTHTRGAWAHPGAAANDRRVVTIMRTHDGGKPKRPGDRGHSRNRRPAACRHGPSQEPSRQSNKDLEYTWIPLC